MTQSSSKTDKDNANKTPIDIKEIIEATQRLQAGEFNIQVPEASGELGRLTEALNELAYTLERRYREVQRIGEITSSINAGLLLDEILDSVYDNFRELIPYQRIGFALIDNGGKTVTARWARTDMPTFKLEGGYTAPLEGSSLQTIIESGQPRIIDDLVEYLEKKLQEAGAPLVGEI